MPGCCNVLLLCFLCCFSKVIGQNAIPNPSFEKVIDFAQKGDSLNWYKVQDSDTPDYFNQISSSYLEFSKNYIGGVNAKEGNAFIGLFCYRATANGLVSNVREFVEVALKDSLKAGEEYELKVSVQLDKESNVAIKNIGLLFSEESIVNYSKSKILRCKPQIVFDSIFIDNSDQWIELTKTFKALGGESFVSIGNFSSDKHTPIKTIRRAKIKDKKSKWGLSKSEIGAYYYFDALSMCAIQKEEVEELVEKVNVTDSFPSLDLSTINLDEIAINTTVALKNIFFDFNKSELLPESFPELNKLFDLMKSNPKAEIKLEGHTDNVGSHEYNMELSLRRTESVVNYLISKGISKHRLEFEGFGFTQPIADNSTEEGRRQNRRVIFRLLNK